MQETERKEGRKEGGREGEEEEGKEGEKEGGWRAVKYTCEENDKDEG